MQQQTVITPNAAIHPLDGMRLETGEQYYIRLDELETNVRVKVYQERSNGSTSLKYITTARASEGLDQTLALTSGTYFIEIASNDNGAGRYNSTYALELEKEEEGENHRFTIANA